MQKITPFLWLDGRVEEAVAFYTSVFGNARVASVNATSARVEIEGQPLILFNGGPHFAFNEAISFFVECETQDEVDYYWKALIAGGGAESRCGWLKDRFGLSWQVVPSVLVRYLGDEDRTRAERVVQAMLRMTKIDIHALDDAYAGR